MDVEQELIVGVRSPRRRGCRRRRRADAARAQRQEHRCLAQPIAAAEHDSRPSRPVYRLPKNRLRLGNLGVAVLVGLDILDRHGTGHIALVGLIERDDEMPG